MVPPDLNSFTLSADSVNTSTEAVTVIYTLSATDLDDYLFDYIIRLILNGGPINGGEIMENTGQFNSDLSTASISGAFVFPIGTTEGQWNARILINDQSNNQANFGPNELVEKNLQSYIIVDNTVLGFEQLNTKPLEFAILENFPNPFNPITTIRYTISAQEQVSISVYDMRGILVKNLLNSFQWPGIKTVQWDATDNYGVAVSAGVYVYKIQAGIFSETKKMILLR